jgi:hypothetical protein
MNDLPIVVYTHTDVKDIWNPFFGRMKKYMSDYKKYICVNKKDDDIPNDYIQIYYDDKKTYTERLVDVLSQIDEDVILFTHEDMILYDTPNYIYLNKYYNYVLNNQIDSIKLLYAGDGGGLKSEIDDTLIFNDFSKFSVNPTIIRKEILEELAKNVGKLSIWDFELSIVGVGMDFMSYKGVEPKRGLYHYDSFVYPHFASAITKGKWNMSEYQKELDELFKDYNVNPFERGIV